MIALNDFKILDTEVEDNDDIISLSTKVNKTNDWSNDFNWTGNDENDENEGGEDAVQLVKATEIDANNSSTLKRPLVNNQNANDLGSGYDIKSIKLVIKNNNEDFFNDMEPVIIKTELNTFDKISSSSSASMLLNNKFSMIEPLKSESEQKLVSTTNWDSVDDIDIDNN